jgi:hypothetical protein
VPRKSHAGPGHVVTVLALSTGVALRLLLRLATVTVTVAVPVPVRQHQAARYGLQAGASKAQAPPSIIVRVRVTVGWRPGNHDRRCHHRAGPDPGPDLSMARVSMSSIA